MTSSRLSRGLALLATLMLLLHGRTADPQGQDSPPLDTPVRGTIDAGGRVLGYAYHFDHNALADAVTLGETLIALTRSGNLLRIDTETLTVTARAVVPERVTALASDDRGAVLAGMEDGQIVAVDPATLDRTLIARAGGPVQWLTRQGDILVAVTGRQRIPPRPGETERVYHRRTQSMWAVFVYRNGRITRHDLPRGFEPNAFLLDGAILRLGMDAGEWGGELRTLDLARGRMSMQSFDSGVLGLVRTSDGRVLAYGGMVHFWTTTSFIADVTGARAMPVFAREEMSVSSETPEEPVGALTPLALPIDRILEDRTGGGFWVLAAHGLYRVSADFASWSRLRALGGLFQGGRRMSIGNTATVTSILPGSRPGEVLAVSTREGIQRVSADRAQRFHLRGQLEEPIVDIWPTSMGTLFLPSTIRSNRIWRIANGEWSATPMCPDGIAASGAGKGTAVATDDMGVLVYCDTTVTPGMSALVRHGIDGRLLTVDRWTSDRSRSPDVLFRGAGRRLFALRYYGEGVLMLRDGSVWRSVGTVRPAVNNSRLPGPEGRAYVTLATANDDALIVLRTVDGTMLRLSARPDGTWRLDGMGRELTEVMDAVPDRNDSILGVTPRGMFRFSARTGRVERLRPPGRDVVLSVARDDAGRLWAAGDRLHISPDDGSTWTAVHLPMVSPTAVKRVRRDPSSPGGMFLSLDDRGLVAIGQ